MGNIKFPITVEKIEFDKELEVYLPGGLGHKCGEMVRVRPCAEKFKGKTFLGVFIGEVALSQSVQHDQENKKLIVSHGMHNPMIFIPSENEVVWGCGSWWGAIKSEEQLQQITDVDIQSVWYVKALKQLDEQSEPGQ